MGQTPKDQHYVPQLLLKNFLDPLLVSRGTQMLWVYEANREPRRVIPKETAFEKYFYSYEQGGEKFHHIEDAFQQMEGLAAPIIGKLANQNFKLTKEEKSDLAGFVALSFTRTPWFRESTNQDVESITKKMNQILAAQPGYLEHVLPTLGITEDIEEEARKVRKFIESDPDLKQTNKAFSIKTSLQSMVSLIPVIERMSYAYYVTEDRQRFLTTDIAVSLYDPDAPLGIGFESSPKAEFHFPISKNVCLVGNWLGIEKPIGVTPATVRKLNKHAMSLAKRFVYASENLNAIRDLFTSLWNERENPRREKDA